MLHSLAWIRVATNVLQLLRHSEPGTSTAGVRSPSVSAGPAAAVAVDASLARAASSRRCPSRRPCPSDLSARHAAIGLINGKLAALRTRLQRVVAKDSPVAISSIVLYELWYGVARSERQRENAERLCVFLSGAIGVVAFDEEDAARGRRAARYAGIGRHAHRTLRPGDRRPSTARMNATLVTANASEFARVRVLDWQHWATKSTLMRAANYARYSR